MQVNTNIQEVLELPECVNGIVDFEVAEIVDSVSGAGQVARGFIYNDNKRKQFEDGEFVRTSIIKDMVTYQDDLYIITINTCYRVIAWVLLEEEE